MLHLLGLLAGEKHLGEVQRQEDGPFGAVVWPKDFHLFHLDACAMVLACPVKQTRSRFIHTVVAGDKRICLSGLPFIHVVTRCCAKHLSLAALKLSQYLIVSLPAHHNLTMNVLNVHILAAMTCIRSHQACLVGNTGLDIVNGCSRGCLLKRARGYICIGRLLDAINRACVLMDMRSLLLLIACRLLLHGWH